MFPTRTFCFFLLFMTALFSFSQGNEPFADSLRYELTKCGDPQQKINIVKELIRVYQQHEADSLNFYADKLVVLGKSENDMDCIAYAQHQYAHAYYLKYDWDEAIIALEKSIELNRKLNKEKFVAVDLQKMGVVLVQLGRLYEASVYFQDLIEYSHQKGLLLNEANAYNNLSNTLSLAEMHEEALTLSLNSLEIKKQLGDETAIADSYFNIGTCYASLGMDKEAEFYIQKAIAFNVENENSKSLCTLYRGLGNIYQDEGELDKALVAYQKSRDMCLIIENKHEEAYTLMLISDLLLELSRFEDALENTAVCLKAAQESEGSELELLSYVQKGKCLIGMKQYQKALVVLKKAEEIELRTSEDEYHPEVFELLTIAYQETGDLDNALNAQIQFKRYADSLTKSIAKVEITKENLHYTFKRERTKDSLIQVRENQAVQERLKQTRIEKKAAEFQKNSIIVLGILFLIAAALFFRFKLKRFQKRKIENESKIKEIKKVLADSKEHVFSLNETLHDKSKQLTSASLNSSHNKQLIGELKHQLRDLICRHEGAVNSDLNKMNNVIRTSEMEKEVIANFILQFEGVHPGYLEHLLNISPKLSTSDLRICAMMKLNLNSHEISTIQGISVNSLRTIRHRIHKKMGIEKGERLQEFLMKVG